MRTISSCRRGLHRDLKPLSLLLTSRLLSPPVFVFACSSGCSSIRNFLKEAGEEVAAAAH